MMDIKNLSVGYGSKPVIKDLTVSALPGKLVALVGPNGSGKSTLIKTVCNVLAKKSGVISWNGSDIDGLSPRDRAKTVSYLSQHREAMPGMTVQDIVALGRAPMRGRLGRLSKAGQDAIRQACENIRIEEYMSRRYETLSGGEQARVLLARSLAVGAPVMLLDEPIAALDPFYQLSIMNILLSEARNGKLVITALHDLGLAQQFADEIWVMKDGKLLAQDTPDNILSSKIYGTVFGIQVPAGGFPKMGLMTPPHM